MSGGSCSRGDVVGVNGQGKKGEVIRQDEEKGLQG